MTNKLGFLKKTFIIMIYNPGYYIILYQKIRETQPFFSSYMEQEIQAPSIQL